MNKDRFQNKIDQHSDYLSEMIVKIKPFELLIKQTSAEPNKTNKFPPLIIKTTIKR